MRTSKRKNGLLQGARVYLSGPMDFVASRAAEKEFGWRNRMSEFLQMMGTTVFDPWFKPGVRGAHQYGLEDINTIDVREEWTFAQGQAGDEKRSQCAEKFWETLHIDLRMVETSDFTIAYVPTNIYSVGTVHEIVLSRLQWKPVLFVSSPVTFPALDQLRAHLNERKDVEALKLLDKLSADVPIKPNPRRATGQLPIRDARANNLQNVSVDLPVEAETPGEAVRQFWSYLRELGPRELPAFVAPLGDELAMQAFVLGEETNLDPEEE